MGGGDLNLKKSWHPSTMKNIEKVWKAEQQQSQEKKKIAELKKEIEMEKDREDMKKYAMEQGVIEKKDDKKLDWMYKGPNQLVNREEYLLGRPIDKSFEQMVQTEKNNELNQVPRNHVEHECIPPSLRFFSGNEQVDLARKMQEDPLCTIKKKEMETRNQLLTNPVKLKQLRQLLEQQSKKRKGEKKKKKTKQDIDSDDEAQLDLLLATKYKQLKDKISNKDLIKSMKKVKHKRKKNSRKENETSNSESESSNEGSESKEKNTEVIKDSKERYLIPDKEEERKHRSYEKLVKACSSSNDNNDRSFNRDIRKHRDNDFRSRSPQNRRSSTHKNTYNTENKYKDLSKRSHEKETIYSKLSSDTNRYKYYKEDKNRDKWNFKKKQVLTEEEKERRRQEMIANATWRDEERERNVKKYRMEEKKEMDSRKVYNQDFVTKQLAAAAEMSTVASRIKANINNIQRSGRAMDTNFAKR
ncbi:pre-mRNA-splicing factor CWC25 homolog isoform X1 [Bombus pascuorum]|uniref:pre-mRNA-splicing factor CWC25 homolog isoform X1 n=2 Tax=Bombus pascuorum TaxID=65598 RepID=UPI002145E6F3|nr:pre-mRNA-splicing factor CWC25 homolog isoform X1 [Bombus pascuorum]XP_060814025.1 pre-mRNA-splicing factor CWC25 homolog isoform X1 [Bombus pascuorum]XP_060814027.1 pre-mRNA-splicing factor CWC25 homolog isoform X1 [Bombus pascuorum]